MDAKLQFFPSPTSLASLSKEHREAKVGGLWGGKES